MNAPDRRSGRTLLGVAVASGVACAAVALLRRSWRQLGPVAALAGTQAAWFSIPYLWAFWTGTRLGGQNVAFLFGWIAIGHAASARPHPRF